MSNNNNIIFETTDTFNRTVVLRRGEYYDHIIKSHVIMDGEEQAIKKTIENPCIIYGSSKKENTDIYFAKSTHSVYPALYTKVVVDFTDEKGRVASAWVCPEIQGVDEGRLKYVKPKI